MAFAILAKASFAPLPGSAFPALPGLRFPGLAHVARFTRGGGTQITPPKGGALTSAHDREGRARVALSYDAPLTVFLSFMHSAPTASPALACSEDPQVLALAIVSRSLPA